MPVASSLLLVLSLIFAVVIGPQTRPWSWGPTMLALSMAVLSALPTIWRRNKTSADIGTIILASLTTIWFAWRAWTSPVPEPAQGELLLLAIVVGGVIASRGIVRNIHAELILIWGIALLLLANLVVIGIQIKTPGYSPVLHSLGIISPSGFLPTYNEAANYLIASSMLIAAAACFGHHTPVTRGFFGLLAIAGLAGVWATHSRGGILAAAVACGVFAAMLLIIGKRNNAKWFAPAIIAIPLVGIAIVGFLFMGWQNAQQARHIGNSSSITDLLDNDCRLYFLGIAMSCIAMHPWTGGGSRSFSWECFQFWDPKTQGFGGAKPEMVHNELAQTATDYGLVGLVLLVALLVTLLLGCLLRVLFENSSTKNDHSDAWRIGGFAALIGMLVQGCFSFVFHTLPGIVLLGICFGFISRSAPSRSGPRLIASQVILSITGLAWMVMLIPAGWQGTMVTRILWPLIGNHDAVVTDETKTDALDQALRIWPQAEFHREKAEINYHAMVTNHGNEAKQLAERALNDYQHAATLRPFDPALQTNIGNLSSILQFETQAENAFANAIRLQGGMEPCFRGHYYLAQHLQTKGIRQFQANQLKSAISNFEQAATEIELASTLTPGYVMGRDGVTLRVAIHEALGTIRETAGDQKGALETYQFAALLRNGEHVHFRIASLLGKQAVNLWSQRKPSEAMAMFIDARKQIDLTNSQRPEGVSQQQFNELITYLNQQIAFLKGAKVEPSR